MVLLFQIDKYELTSKTNQNLLKQGRQNKSKFSKLFLASTTNRLSGYDVFPLSHNILAKGLNVSFVSTFAALCILQ